MAKSLFALFSLSALMSITSASCYYDNVETLYGSSTTITCDTTNLKYSVYMTPFLVANCNTSGCHNSKDKANGIAFDSYASIKSYLDGNKARFTGSIQHLSGYSSMPQGVSTKLPDCDITKILKWINGGYPNN